MQIPSFFCFVFSSRIVKTSGSVEDYPVPAITVDAATDVSVVYHAWLTSHPTLRSLTIQPVPPTAVALRAATGSWLNVLGFVVFSLTLSTITHDVEALVVPSLRPDSILLDNIVMSIFGAVLDWENQVLSFLSAGNSIPGVHRTSHPASRTAVPPLPLATLTCPSPMSTMMQKELMSACANVSTLNLDTRPLS